MSCRCLSPVLCLALTLSTVAALGAQTTSHKEQDRLITAGVVLNEILNVPETIPQDILDKAECVIVIPSMTKIAVGFGGSHGRGAMVCRSGEAFDGRWGAPALYAIEGGSFGLQLGVESTDVVLMVMNPRGVNALLNSKVKLGGEASVAAGPKGRQVGASTDLSMLAEILSYSRSRGLFAGISLEGAWLRPDDDGSEEVYGRRISARDIILGAVEVPPSGRTLVDVLQQRAPRNLSGSNGP